MFPKVETVMLQSSDFLSSHCIRFITSFIKNLEDMFLFGLIMIFIILSKLAGSTYRMTSMDKHLIIIKKKNHKM